MRKIRDVLGEDLDEASEFVVEAALILNVNILDIVEDPAENEAVAEILQEVGRRIEDSGSDRLKDRYRRMCEVIGLPHSEESEEVILDLRPVTSEFLAAESSSSTGRISVARMTGRVASDDVAALERDKKELPIGPSRMKLIKRGTITLEICESKEGVDKYSKGDQVLLIREDEKVRVLITRVGEYEELKKLIEQEHENLGNWLGMSANDALPFVSKMYKDADTKGRGFVVYEFEKVNK